MYKIVLVFICAVILSSCKQQSKDRSAVHQSQVLDTRIYQQLDSVLTEEMALVQKTIVTHLKVVDNRMVFPLTKEEFVALGIPGIYYDRLLEDLSDVNHLIDSLGINNAEEMLAGSYRDLYEIYGLPQEKQN